MLLLAQSNNISKTTQAFTSLKYSTLPLFLKRISGIVLFDLITAPLNRCVFQPDRQIYEYLKNVHLDWTTINAPLSDLPGDLYV